MRLASISMPACVYLQTMLQLRKDKYEKIYWYWVDVAYEGEQVRAETEDLTRTTEISSGAQVDSLALGLSKGGQVPPAVDSDHEDADYDDDDDELEIASADEFSGSRDESEPSEPVKIKRKRKAKLEEELPEEAIW